MNRIYRRLPVACTRGLIIPRRTFLNFPSFGNMSGSELQTYTVKKRVNVTPKLMFDVVSKVDRYSEFVPFVENSFVNKYDDNTKLPIEGGLAIGWKEFEESFNCKLTCIESEKVIAESLSTNLFESLYNEWNFKEVRFINNLSCEVELILKFKFKNPLYNTLSSMFSDQVTKIMIKSFEERAMELKLKEMLKNRETKFAKIK